MKLSKATIKRVTAIIAVAAILLYQHFQGDSPLKPAPGTTSQTNGRDTSTGWRDEQWLEIQGTVSRMLRDDDHGSRHQRFIITLADKRTLLIAHNIDLAPRVPLHKGDTVIVRGQYEVNDRGGVIHWTHDDPDGNSPRGWIEHKGQRYH